jgi:hypothetical protein
MMVDCSWRRLRLALFCLAFGDLGDVARKALALCSGFQFRVALNPSQASTAATTQTTQLAHNGIEWVAPMVMAQPLTARTNCSKATMVKMIAAKRE